MITKVVVIVMFRVIVQVQNITGVVLLTVVMPVEILVEQQNQDRAVLV